MQSTALHSVKISGYINKKVSVSKGITCQKVSGAAVMVRVYITMIIKRTEQTSNCETVRK
jgi:hypothetical protein